MHNIEGRIAALEATNMPADEMTIIRRFVSPGGADSPLAGCRWQFVGATARRD